MKKILDLSGQYYVQKYSISRAHDGGPLSLEIEFYDGEVIKLVILKNVNSSWGHLIPSYLLDLIRFSIYTEPNSQRESGTYKIVCHNEESEVEFWCDEFEAF